MHEVWLMFAMRNTLSFEHTPVKSQREPFESQPIASYDEKEINCWGMDTSRLAQPSWSRRRDRTRFFLHARSKLFVR